MLQEGDREKLANLSSSIPTVENPQLHLFKDISLSAEDREKILGLELANIQITKGCSHKCEFCAAGAASKVQMMPFVAVLKLGQLKKEIDGEDEEATADWQRILDKRQQWREERRKPGPLRVVGVSTVSDVLKIAGVRLNPEDLKDPELHPYLSAVYENHPVKKYLEKARKGLLVGDEALNLYESSITNYYDSDPFDYRDATFLHQDGTPADYGDVFNALATNIRPIYITTAGWSRHNKLAQRAMGKIIDANQNAPGRLANARLSISPYELRARQSTHEYVEDSKRNIDDFAELRSKGIVDGIVDENVLFFCPDDDEQFKNEVVQPLEEYIKGKYPHLRHIRPNISFYSGPMADPDLEGKHHDVMACMGGYHIWPDGTIAMQSYDKLGSKGRSIHRRQVQKGERPIATGGKAF